MHKLLTTLEAADYLRVSPKTLEARRVRGNGPKYLKYSRKILYRLTDLEAWIESSARTSTSETGSPKTMMATGQSG